MRLRPARRLGVLTTALLATGLLAPTVASAAPTGNAPSGTAPTIARADADPTAQAATNRPIEVRDLSDACPSGQVARAGFRDVPSNFAFARAIDCLVGYAITQGKTATTYDPNGDVTRRQMAVFLYRMLDDLIVLPDPPARSQFRDVPLDGEVGRAVNVLASDELAAMLGFRIIAGRTADTFEPAGQVTRAQMGSFIARTLEGTLAAKGMLITEPGRCDNVFSDERTIPPAHLDNVKLLCAGGIVTGRTDGTYGPSANVTRGQMAAFLMRLMDVLVDDTEAGIARPAHLRSEVFVDRGTGASACTATDRDGSASRPFCTIQEGVDAAAAREGHAVRVHVIGRAGQPAYDEGYIEIEPAGAHTIDVVGRHAAGGRVPVASTFEVFGDDEDVFYGLGRLRIAEEYNAVYAEGAGFVALSNVEARGEVAVYIDQFDGGRTYLLGSRLASEYVSLGVESSDLVLSRGTRYLGAPEAYVVLVIEASGPQVREIFQESFLDPALGNRFERTPRQGEFEGYPALVPAS